MKFSSREKPKLKKTMVLPRKEDGAELLRRDGARSLSSYACAFRSCVGRGVGGVLVCKGVGACVCIGIHSLTYSSCSLNGRDDSVNNFFSGMKWGER